MTQWSSKGLYVLCLTRKWGLYKGPSSNFRGDRALIRYSSPLIVVETHWVLGHELVYRWVEHNLPWRMSLNILYTFFINLDVYARDLYEKKEYSSFLWPKPLHPQKKSTWQHKNATKNFDYTTIADVLRTDSWVTIATQLVWLKRFTGSQPSH